MNQVDVWRQQASRARRPARPGDRGPARGHGDQLQRPRPARPGHHRERNGHHVRLRPGHLPPDPPDHHPAQRTGRPAGRPGPRLLLRPGRQHHPDPRHRRHRRTSSSSETSGWSPRRLHLRSAVPADPGHRPGAPRPDRQWRAAPARPGHQRRLVPHRAAPARRRPGHGHLHRDLHLRPGGQHHGHESSGQLGLVDPPLRLRPSRPRSTRPRAATGSPPPASPATRPLALITPSTSTTPTAT